MVQPKCVKCEGTKFELVDVTSQTFGAPLKNSMKAYNFVCCSKCGGAVGVVEQHHITSLLYQIMEKLGIKAT